VELRGRFVYRVLKLTDERVFWSWGVSLWLFCNSNFERRKYPGNHEGYIKALETIICLLEAFLGNTEGGSVTLDFEGRTKECSGNGTSLSLSLSRGRFYFL
jgi:hypothetical protein